jgi:hypothetical protein
MMIDHGGAAMPCVVAYDIDLADGACLEVFFVMEDGQRCTHPASHDDDDDRSSKARIVLMQEKH